MTDFEKWTVKALREYCRKQNIKIPLKSKKVDIITLIENTPHTLKVELVPDPLTEQRQKIIKEVMKMCHKDGVKKILNYFKRRSENRRLKQVFDIYKLNLENPTMNEIRVCLKYFQEVYEYDDDDKLLLNQMIAQPKYISPDYIDPRLEEFKQFKIDSATYDMPISKTSKQEELNKTRTLKE